MSKNAKTVVLTGGGTAGHVIPNLALVEDLRAQGWSIYYIGSTGIESQLVPQAGVPFKKIASGKLRRYFSLQNFADVFKVILGFFQSLALFVFYDRPNIIFAKGGYVSVPVAVAAWILRIPVICHESDLTPGLANRMVFPFTRRILYSFSTTVAYVPASRSTHVGSPVRKDLSRGDAQAGLKLCGFSPDSSKPLLLIMGGSLGAQRVNAAVQAALEDLLKTFRIVHIAGKGKAFAYQHPDYKCFEYLNQELKDVLACTDLVLSRSGANAIFEFLSLHKPMLLIPLEIGSRGDQIHNADYFAERGWALVLSERELTPGSLYAHLQTLAANVDQMVLRQKEYRAQETIPKIVAILSSHMS